MEKHKLKNMPFRLYLFFFILLFLFACDSEINYTPKPRAYPKIEFPKKAYQSFEEDYCHFTFEYPQYASIEQDTLFFNEKPADPCWFDIFVKDFDCRIHCTYYPINAKNSFEKLNSDAFKMSREHVAKAEFVDPEPVKTTSGATGFVFKLEGPVATPCQFFLTDSTHHFMRAALYFNAKIRPDSLAPLIDFIEKDIEHMIETFKWNEK